MLVSNALLVVSRESQARCWYFQHVNKTSALNFSISTSKIHLAEVQGGFENSKMSGVGTNFGLLVHVLPGSNKGLLVNQVYFRAGLRDETIRPVASCVLGIHFKTQSFYDLRCARLAISIIENKC
jgi:hypothetical protein